MQYIKQSTAATLKLGPFVDDTDGKTPETALTIAQADVRLSKNGGNIAQKAEATSCTHDELGIYDCPIDVTDSAALGRLQLFVMEAGALPVWHEYMVLPANVYDSLFGSDKLEVDLLQMGGVAQSATDLKDFADAGYDPAAHKAEGVKLADVTTLNSDMKGTDGAALATVCTEVRLARLDAAISTRSSHTAADVWTAGARELSTPADYKADVSLLALAAGVQLSAQGKQDVNLECDNALVDYDAPTRAEATADKDALIADLLTMKQPVAGGFDRETDSLEAIRDRGDAAWSAAAGNPSVLIDTAIATLASQTSFTLLMGSDDNDAYKDQAIVLYDASNNDYPSVRKVSGYVGATKTVTLDAAPDFIAIEGDGVKTFVTAPGTTAPTAGQVADAVLDELVGDHVGPGSLSKAVSDTLEDTCTTIPGILTPIGTDVTEILADVIGINGDPMRGTENAALASVCLEARLARLDAAISTRSSHAAADIWAVGTRALTDKVGFGLSAAAINAIWEKDISAYVGAKAGTYLKTVYDDWFNAGRLDLVLDTIAADVVNIDGDSMKGTDNAALATVCTEGRLAELDAANLPADVDKVLLDTGTDGVVVAAGSKTGYALSAAGVDAIFDEEIENTTTLRQMLRIFTAALAGKSTGGGTATVNFRDILNLKDRITATVDVNGNRTAISVDGT